MPDDVSQSDLPSRLPKPALRALAAAGYTRLAQLRSVSDTDLLRLHGVGPKAVRILREALAASGGSLAHARLGSAPDPG